MSIILHYPWINLTFIQRKLYKEPSIYKFAAIVVKSQIASFVNQLRQYDVGADFGIGYQTSITGGIDLFVGVDYRIGFFSIEDKNKKQINNKKLRNQVFCVSAGIYFVKNRRSKTYRHHR